MSSGNLGDFPRRLEQTAAVVDLSRGQERRFDFDAYARKVDGVAEMLAVRGLPRGAKISILGRNSAEYLAAYFGIMKAGYVAVPVNHKFPKDMVEFVMGDAGVELVFCDDEFRHLFPAGIPIITLEDISGTEASAPFQAVDPAPADIGMILYTSGSTGRPKGVPLTHAGQRWVIEMRSSIAAYGEHRMLIAAPLCHMNGLLMAKIAAYNGAEVVLLPEFSASAYINAISRYRCTWITSVPTMLALVARERELLANSDLTSVRVAAMGSAPVSMTLFNEVAALFPSASVATNYGTTEAGAGIFGPHPDGLPRPPLSLGYPLPGIGFRLVDEKGEDASEGVLYLKTPAMTPGYINRPEATAKLFADGWLVTGDVIRRDEAGFCYFVRRADDMFVSGGENIYPAAVEEILEKHPAVEQACVVPVPDELKGFKPVAFVVARSGMDVGEDELKQHVLKHAPAYMHPRKIYFIGTMPLSPTNKIDRASLQKRAVETSLQEAAI